MVKKEKDDFFPLSQLYFVFGLLPNLSQGCQDCPSVMAALTLRTCLHGATMHTRRDVKL